MGVVVSSKATIVTLGNLCDPVVLFGLFGLFVALLLSILKIRDALIISIIVTSAVAWIGGFSPLPKEFVSVPASISEIAFELDIKSAFSLALVPVIITFLITDIFDIIGTIVGVGLRANLFKHKDSVALQKTMEADAGATILSGLLGVTSTTAFIESATGGGGRGW